MTLEERARKIVQIVHGQVLAFEPRAAVEEVEWEIREAVNEAESELLNNGTYAQRVSALAKAEAYEEAARIADHIADLLPNGVVAQKQSRAIAKAIRARAADAAAEVFFVEKVWDYEERKKKENGDI